MGLHNIAVYGTLLKGYPNCDYILDRHNGSVRFAGRGRTTKPARLVTLPPCYSPFLLDPTDRRSWYGALYQVYVEVWEVDDRMLTSLDRLEMYDPTNPENSLYERRPICVTFENGDKTTAQAYVLVDFIPEVLDLPTHPGYTDDVAATYVTMEQRVKWYGSKEGYVKMTLQQWTTKL